MKTHVSITSLRRSIIAGAFVAFASVSHAAIINWGAGAQGITGDSDVSTAGALVGAVNLGPANVPTTTVNGVTFTGLAMPSGSTAAAVGNFSLTSPGISFSGILSSGSAPFSNLSAPYQVLLSNIVGGTGSSPITLTINGLATGQAYQFQWWTSDPLSNGIFTTATAGNAVTLSVNTGVVPGGLGQFATGTFTADANSQTITFSGSLPVLSGFQLRNLAPATAVPEPGSALAGMLALGVCLGGVVKRSRRLTVEA